MSLIEKTVIKLRQKNYAKSTQHTYLHFINDYLDFCQKRSLNVEEDTSQYLMFLIDNDYAISTQNQAINAIKFYLEHILGCERTYIEIDRPFKPKYLPTVLSLQEVKAILDKEKKEERLTEGEKKQLIEARVLQHEIVTVDAFTHEDYMHKIGAKD